jgi:hypothetical protein
MKLANVEMRFNLPRKYYCFLSAHKKVWKVTIPARKEFQSISSQKPRLRERELWIQS